MNILGSGSPAFCCWLVLIIRFFFFLRIKNHRRVFVHRDAQTIGTIRKVKANEEKMVSRTWTMLLAKFVQCKCKFIYSDWILLWLWFKNCSLISRALPRTGFTRNYASNQTRLDIVRLLTDIEKIFFASSLCASLCLSFQESAQLLANCSIKRLTLSETSVFKEIRTMADNACQKMYWMLQVCAQKNERHAGEYSITRCSLFFVWKNSFLCGQEERTFL